MEDMKGIYSFNFRKKKQYDGYTAYVHIDELSYEFLLDTGAACTMLPISTNDLKDCVQKGSIEVYKDNKFTFYTATGTKCDVYFCKMKDVFIENMLLKTFYCYISIYDDSINNSELKTAVLGRDFLDNASFSHAIGSGIITISAISISEYEKNCIAINKALKGNSQSDKNISPSSEQINVITREDEKHKDIAASFRDFYGNIFPNMKAINNN